MTSNEESQDPTPPKKKGEDSKGKPVNPEWAQGLRQLYDSVVEEELPTSFKDLLSKLDEKD